VANPIEITGTGDLTAENVNCLVKIDGCKFSPADDGQPLSNNDFTTDRTVTFNGASVVVRTSNYATFANETLPLGTGDITGILTRYNNYVQIVINSPADLVGFTAPVERQTVFSVNYSNAFNEGWLQTGTGNPWQTMVNNNFSGFFVNPSADEDYYLISPAIYLDNTTEPELSFTHRAPQGFDPNTMMCFYTPNYTGDVNTTLWIPFDLSAAAGQTTSNNFSIALPEGAQTSNFRLMFHITTAPSAWYLSDIKITGVVR